GSAASRARPLRVAGVDAAGALRRDSLSFHQRPALPAVARRLRFLLVPAATAGTRRRPMNVTLEELTTWLDRQRSYGNKGVPISKVEVLDRLQLAGSESVEAEASVVNVTYLLGTPERYLAFLERGADGALRDALEDPAVARGVLSFARRGGRVSVGGTGHSVKAEVIADGAHVLDRLPREPAVRALGVEQSNTSLVLGEKVLLKIFRKLEPGLNPELEMGRFLAVHDFKATPKLLAALTLEGATS